MYFNPHDNTCVADIMECPCYLNGSVYRPGDKTPSLLPMKQQECICSGADIKCSGISVHQKELCIQEEEYTYCTNNNTGKICEPSCENQIYKQMPCTEVCEEGCICKPGLVRSPEGNCINKTQCPCIHEGQLYSSKEVIQSDCNVCTCQSGIINCTTKDCRKLCFAYGESQYVLYDNIWLEYESNNCEILLTESLPHATKIPFRVGVKNVCNRFGGSICRKLINITVGGDSLILDNVDKITSHSEEPNYPFRISHVGFYIIVETAVGLTVYWDLHLQVLVQIKDELMKLVQGFCGEGDESVSTHLNNIKMLGTEYGKQWVTSMCKPQIVKMPLTQSISYAETHCKQLLSDVFSPCHQKINVEQYYKSCKSTTSKCYKGEDQQCFCNAIAAYSQACCRQGIIIHWRNADNCPSHCEYYNRVHGSDPHFINNMNGLTISIDFVNKRLLLEKYNNTRVLQMSFLFTPALYKAISNSDKYMSLESVKYPNYFVRYFDNGTITLEKWQMGDLFRKQASFLVHKNRWFAKYNAFESFTSRQEFLFANPNGIISMEKYDVRKRMAMSFKTTECDFAIPEYTLCEWVYRPCESPCLKTCQDPLGSKCTLSVKIEGCFPHCAEDKVLDETTYRCVRLDECTSPATGHSRLPGVPLMEFIPPLTNTETKILDTITDNTSMLTSETMGTNNTTNSEIILQQINTATHEIRATSNDTMNPKTMNIQTNTTTNKPGLSDINTMVSETFSNQFNTAETLDTHNYTIALKTMDTKNSTAAPETLSTQTNLNVPKSVYTQYNSITAEVWGNLTNASTHEAGDTNIKKLVHDTFNIQLNATFPETLVNHNTANNLKKINMNTSTTAAEKISTNSNKFALETMSRPINILDPETMTTQINTTAPETLSIQTNIIAPETTAIQINTSAPETMSRLTNTAAPETMATWVNTATPETTTSQINTSALVTMSIRTHTITPATKVTQINTITSETMTTQINTIAPETTLTRINTIAPETMLTQINTTAPETTLTQINTTAPETMLTQINTTAPEITLTQINTTTPETMLTQINTIAPETTLTQINTTAPADQYNRS
ncbi:otogelin-like protein [Chiloscyllium plagiosum]|uniref:otogelin-like protein n=1 Tax=Chiloscyllium plagiosum TaxID=36176 RepID=UPI001CB7FF07|nr:otogelin-like protein [Chiloscyllium plagiosum]